MDAVVETEPLVSTDSGPRADTDPGSLTEVDTPELDSDPVDPDSLKGPDSLPVLDSEADSLDDSDSLPEVDSESDPLIDADPEIDSLPEMDSEVD